MRKDWSDKILINKKYQNSKDEKLLPHDGLKTWETFIKFSLLNTWKEYFKRFLCNYFGVRLNYIKSSYYCEKIDAQT